MEKVAAEVDKLCREKLLAYHNIIDILRQEKEGFRDMNLNTLWEFSRRKNENIAVIQDIRSRIVQTLQASGIETKSVARPFKLSEIAPFFPGRASSKLLATVSLIEKAKTEIQAAGTANRLFINEYLAAFDEILGVFTSRNSNKVYGQNRNYLQNGYGSSRLVHREA